MLLTVGASTSCSDGGASEEPFGDASVDAAVGSTFLFFFSGFVESGGIDMVSWTESEAVAAATFAPFALASLVFCFSRLSL